MPELPTTMKGKTLLKGHTLISEGKARVDRSCMECEALGWIARRKGHAKCSCGALSPHLPSKTKRQAWHREVHKEAIRSAQRASKDS